MTSISVKNLLRAGFVALALSGLGACASGPTYDALHASEPPVAADSARIYFYRAAEMAGSAVQPSVKINGETVGDAVPGGYFYVDRPAGTYEISTSTEVKEAISVTVKPGETRYVKFTISMGLFVGHVSPQLIWPEQAVAELAACHYTGDAKK